MHNFGPNEALEIAKELIRNADALLTEAQVLHDAGHNARAYYLATIAFEEISKIYPCFDVMGGARIKPGDLKFAWTNHREKLSTAVALEAAFLRDDVLSDFDGWLDRDEVGPWSAAKMAALYVDVDAEGQVRRPSATRADEASRAISRGLAASQLIHQVLDPVTPEILQAKPEELAAVQALLEVILDDEDPETSISLVRRTLSAATAGDAAELQSVLSDALARYQKRTNEL